MDPNNTVADMEEKMDKFARACRSASLKVTQQRIEIYKSLLLLPDHPSAETIYKRILPSLPTISLDTVYRTLATLEQHGLVARIQTSESQARFEAVITSHHHIICSNCKGVMDFQWPEIEKLPLPQSVGGWGRINSRNLVMYGLCSSCAVG